MAWFENILQFLLLGKPVWQSDLKTWFQVNKNFWFFRCNLHHKKNWVKNETLKYWILFLLKNEKFMSVLYDQITQCSDSLTFTLVSATSTKDVPPYEAKELWITHICNIAHVNCCTCTYFFLKQTEHSYLNIQIQNQQGKLFFKWACYFHFLF